MTDQNAPDPVILFPGQGSQENNMGRALAERSTQAMERWEKAERLSKLPLREIYWETDNDDMADTQALQPAMFVTAFNLWEHLANIYMPPFTAGHSLGEFTALAAAQVLSPDEILEMVILRSQLMAGVDPSGTGAMAAVLKLDHDQVEAVVNQARESDLELRIGNYNSPNQYVISGLASAVEKAEALVKERKGRAVRLAVSGAFHSPLMKDAAMELAEYMTRLNWQTPRIPIHFNVTSKTEDNPETIRSIMQNQMVSSVLWMWIIDNQWQAGVRSWLELGPKGVLTRLLKPILAPKKEEWEGRCLTSPDTAV